MATTPATIRHKIRLPALRPLQQALYRAMRRWNVWVCHRRFGKTLLALCVLLKHAFECRRPSPRFAYIAPLYRQAKAIAWDYVKRFASQLPGCTTNEAELRLDLPTGARVQLLGADNPDSHRGIYLDGAVLDEYGKMAPRAYREVIRPALADRQGWAIWIGTPSGRNHFYDLYQQAQARVEDGDPEWAHALYRASETGILAASELADMRATMSDAEYMQELECAFDAPIPGAVYGDELRQMLQDGRQCPLIAQAGYPVQTCWDIGPAHTAIWWFQVLPAADGGGWYHWIDYATNEPQTIHSLPYWVKEVRSRPYLYNHALLGLTRERYEQHWGPHDLDDPDYGTGKSRRTIAQEAVLLDDGRRVEGLRFTVVPKGPVEDGIETVRKVLRRSRIDTVRCEDGLLALSNYRYVWDETAQAFTKTPRHDWASHGADALRTGAVGLHPLPAPGAPQAPGGSFEWARRQAKRAREGRPTTTFRR